MLFFSYLSSGIVSETILCIDFPKMQYMPGYFALMLHVWMEQSLMNFQFNLLSISQQIQTIFMNLFRVGG